MGHFNFLFRSQQLAEQLAQAITKDMEYVEKDAFSAQLAEERKAFLEFMRERNHSTLHLLAQKESEEKVNVSVTDHFLACLSDMDKLKLVSDIVQGMDDAFRAWEESTGTLDKVDEGLHWPRIESVCFMNDGIARITPDSLVADEDRKRTFCTIWNGVFPEARRGLPRCQPNPSPAEAHSFILDYATHILEADDNIKEKWREHFLSTLVVDYSTFVDQFSGGLPERCINIIFCMINSSCNRKPTVPKRISYKMFCESGKIYGCWWKGLMANALSTVIDSRHFFIVSSSGAQAKLRKIPDIEYIIRPRSTVGNHDNNTLWPFALTVRNERVTLHYVISFDMINSTFYIEDEGRRFEAEGADISRLCHDFYYWILRD